MTQGTPPSKPRTRDESVCDSPIVIGQLHIDPVTRKVTRTGRVIPLPELSFRLLHALARAAPNGLSYRQLMDRVWAGRVVGEETVTQRVRLLRKALDDQAGSGRLILTERGRGYRMAGRPQVEAVSRRSMAWPWPAVVLALVAIAGAGGAVWYLASARNSAEVDAAVGDEVATVTVAQGAIVVDDLLRRGWEYFSRHQRDDNELALTLFREAHAKAPDDLEPLAAISMAHAQRATKFNGGPEEVATALHWAERALRKDGDSVQAHLAMATALDAGGHIDAAIAAYERVLQREPDHRAARSSVAYLYEISGDLVRALRYNLLASRLPASGPYQQLQVGKVLQLLGFGPAAEHYFKRAEQLQPDNVFAPVVRADYLMAQGRLAEAEAVISAAIARGVRRPELHIQKGLLALLAGDDAAAERAFTAALDVAPHSSEAINWRLVLQCRQGQPDRSALDARLAKLRAGMSGGDFWPTLPLQELDLLASCGAVDQAPVAMQALVQAGYRDTATLRFRPSLTPVRDSPAFREMIERIQADLARQREAVLAADWLPDGLLTPGG